MWEKLLKYKLEEVLIDLEQSVWLTSQWKVWMAAKMSGFLSFEFVFPNGGKDPYTVFQRKNNIYSEEKGLQSYIFLQLL